MGRRGSHKCGKVGRKETTRKTKTWLDNINMNIVEIGWGGVDWIGLAQVRDSFCESGNENSSSIKCWETIKWLDNWWPLE
jgi:hypothetical protein